MFFSIYSKIFRQPILDFYKNVSDAPVKKEFNSLVLPHPRALFVHLVQEWFDLFWSNKKYLLLYILYLQTLVEWTFRYFSFNFGTPKRKMRVKLEMECWVPKMGKKKCLKNIQINTENWFNKICVFR